MTHHISPTIYDLSHTVNHIWLFTCGRPYMSHHILSTIYYSPYIINHIRSTICGVFFNDSTIVFCRIWTIIYGYSYMVNHIWTVIYKKSHWEFPLDFGTVYASSYMVDHIWWTIYDRYYNHIPSLNNLLFSPYMINHIWFSSKIIYRTICEYFRPYMLILENTVYDYFTIYDSPYMTITVYDSIYDPSFRWDARGGTRLP